MASIAVNSFAKRQTAQSHYSHYAGTWEALTALVAGNFDQAKPGYRDGVVLVPVPAEGFFTGLVLVTETTELVAKLTTRAPGEEPYIAVYARNADKAPATSVSIVLYRHDVLAEDDDAETDADWEIIAILASPEPEDLPMDPVTMMRNHLHLPGGTQGRFTGDQFAASIRAAEKYVGILSVAAP